MAYRRNRRNGGTFFIAGAIKSPGALTRYVENTFGEEGFSSVDGRRVIRSRVISKIKSGKCPVCVSGKCVCPTKLTRQRARFAALLRSFHE